MGTFKKVKESEVDKRIKGLEILPLRWVFAYKLDSDGYLILYKARLCARGDRQLDWDNVYAATASGSRL